MGGNRVYLSVDLDFWQRRFPKAYFDRLAHLPVPKCLVVSHEQMLAHVNKQDFDVLANVDYHSDIADLNPRHPRKPELCDGTWVNHVHGRKRKKFIWSCPDRHRCLDQMSGTCHSVINPFSTRTPLEDAGWKHIVCRERWYPPLDDVVGVGIAISPEYTRTKMLERFLSWMDAKMDNFYLLPKRQTRRGVRKAVLDMLC